MYDTSKFKLHTCYHCGNKGLMPIEHVHAHTFGGPVFDECGDCIDMEPEENFRWNLLSCPVCGFVTLLEEYNAEWMMTGNTELSTLYPQSSTSEVGIPATVKTAFDAALKVKNIDNEICALSLRRVLEAICKDKGASGNNLEKMINDMIERKILPELFDDACWIVRQLGNSAAHADNVHFSKQQVEETIGFVQSIISYLYTLPLQMKEMRTTVERDMNKRKKSTPKEHS